MSLKDEMRAQAEEKEKKMSDSAGISVEDRTDIADTMRQDAARSVAEETLQVYHQLNEPVQTDDGKVQDVDSSLGNWRDGEIFSIGNWRNLACRNYENRGKSADLSLTNEERLKFQKKRAELTEVFVSNETSRIQDVPVKPDALIDHSKIKFVAAEDDVEHSEAFAYFSGGDQSITFHQYTPVNDSSDPNTPVNDSSLEYVRGNSIAKTAILMHENAHKDHWVYDGQGILQTSPVNAAKSNRLTETVACSTEYLNAAHQYTLLKEQGVKNVSVARNYTLAQVMTKYNALEAEKRPELGEYLKSAGIETVHISKADDMLGLWIDYGQVAQEPKPKFSDYLKSRGIKNLEMTGEPKMQSVDALKEKLDEPRKGYKELVDELGLNKNAQYRFSSERPIEEVIENLQSVENLAQKGEAIDGSLAYAGLGRAYVTAVDNMPIEGILEMHDGLKEVVSKHGFDPNNPKSVRRVVEASSKYWHEGWRQEAYTKQMLTSADVGKMYFDTKSWSEQIKILENEDKNYQDVSARMLKDVYIGHNTMVDLSGCRDLLDTLSTPGALSEFSRHNMKLDMNSQEEKEIWGNKINPVSLAEMKEIDAYLTKKGLKTDDEKMAYMSRYMEDMAYRRGQVNDEELTAILMKYNNNITYQDNLSVSYGRDGRVSATLQNKNYDLTPLMASEGKGDKKQSSEEMSSQDYVQAQIRAAKDNTR
ncbi:MAG: hypothetical protein J6B00_02040 [Alphaproteobacteria bacterium]|nr:hypothetical protein [Alphaproteobacteria bacterium]